MVSKEIGDGELTGETKAFQAIPENLAHWDQKTSGNQNSYTSADSQKQECCAEEFLRSIPFHSTVCSNHPKSKKCQHSTQFEK